MVPILNGIGTDVACVGVSMDTFSYCQISNFGVSK